MVSVVKHLCFCRPGGRIRVDGSGHMEFTSVMKVILRAESRPHIHTYNSARATRAEWAARHDESMGSGFGFFGVFRLQATGVYHKLQLYHKGGWLAIHGNAQVWHNSIDTCPYADS